MSQPTRVQMIIEQVGIYQQTGKLTKSVWNQ